ncbi:MAG: 4-hydroxy-3-methylbut-2-enyl diphosphate reductase [Candidatus Omnitrophica bacterium]|nr:4-hydroxy-3-methylbut-2-enyl diphosphate reductase [Candidatus Omnitrophota bacterium]MBU0897298.1 4-hydroxy-3-methylbut-2-enyl diphosphate reductase [Candidatus Omnitrophota bacterium]MBU1809773.1 4-hydroxy-3-methylbut-2-enyl diphosphate reductase [Candidatus Omnitrophota bacterium]
MKTYRAKHTGFCFGVKRAIQMAKETAASYKNVYIKGDLVHNEKVCRQIEKTGIKRVNSLKSIPKHATIIIKAHGEPYKTYQEAKLRNLKIVDATCSMVLDIHKKVRQLQDEGYQIIVVGDRNHQETKGIIGNTKGGLIVENNLDVDKLKGKIGKKVGVVCQSTQDIDKISQIISQLVRHTEKLLFINTICLPTRLRQEEIKKLASVCEAVLVIGSRKSANTKRLYRLGKKINKNIFWIDNPQKINKDKFDKFQSIGIIGGASTPGEILEKVYKELNDL